VAESTLYDEIGARYSERRQPDPRIFEVVRSALGEARRIVNVGAGAGSYEPADITVAAVEPSSVMRRSGPLTWSRQCFPVPSTFPSWTARSTGPWPC
jgi:hypothetical protein